MFVRSFQRAVAIFAFTGLSAGLDVTPASAQTHRLTESHATVIRGGSFANTNLSSESRLATRASADSEFVRRIVMKFDTQTPIPHRSSIASATLTLTVAGGNAQNRILTAYRVTTSFEEDEATWNRRKNAETWRAGGDLGEVWATRTATASVGTQVTFDVTSLVQAAVNGNFGSRYTRVAIVDAGGSSRDSYKEFHSDEAGDASVRPTLTVTLGSGTSVPSPAPQPSTANTIKFLHWNSIVVNGRPINVFSTHLDADSSSRRSTQMNELKSWMLQFSEQRVVGGDFNTWPTAGEIPSMTGTYEDVWAEAARAGTSVAYPGNTGGNTRNTRIDYVFLSKGASSVVIRGAQVFDARNSSGVMPSDHRPLLATLEVR